MADLNASLNTEDIVDDVDTERARLDRAGDRWMAEGEGRSFARDQGLRSAVKADVDAGRGWARERALAARERIEEAPLKASLYALGVGVLVGVLLRR